MTQGKQMPHMSTNPVKDYDYLTLNGIVFFKVTPEREAVPELLHALKIAQKYMKGAYQHEIDMVRNVIAQAEGTP